MSQVRASGDRVESAAPSVLRNEDGRVMWEVSVPGADAPGSPRAPLRGEDEAETHGPEGESVAREAESR